MNLAVNKHRPSAVRVAQIIRSKIADQALRPYDRLPTIKQLTEMTGATSYAVRSAIGVLQKEGVVEATCGRGILVGTGAQEKKLRNVGIIWALLHTAAGMQIVHGRTVEGVFAECASLGAMPLLLSPAVNLLDAEAVLQHLRDQQVDGAIWMYPSYRHWDTIRAIRAAGMPIVVTSHSQIAMAECPCIESDLSSAGMLAGQHFLENRCDRIIYFYDSNPHEDGENARPGRSARFVSFNLALAGSLTHSALAVEQGRPDFQPIASRTDANTWEWASTFRAHLQDAGQRTGVVFFYRPVLFVLKEILEALRGCEVVIVAGDGDRETLALLAEELDFRVLVLPLRAKGVLAVRKLSSLVAGHEEKGSSTLMKIPFGRFADVFPDRLGGQ